MHRLYPILFLPLFTGCAALEMAQTWQLDRLRVLATKSVPAEPQPGETVLLESLTYAPSGESVDAVIWFGCLADNATAFGCTIDGTILEQINTPPEDPADQLEWFATLQEAGLLGVEPALPPTWTIPETALDGLEEADKVEGLSAYMNLTALPTDPEDDADVEILYKRLPISLNPEPNQNPDIAHLLVNGTEYSAGEVPRIQQGQTLDFDIQFADGAVEEYTYTNPDTSESEQRTETPYLSWYAESGTFNSFVSLLPYTEVTWTAPEYATRSEIIVTVRDRRGGMDWLRFDVIVEAE